MSRVPVAYSRTTGSIQRCLGHKLSRNVRGKPKETFINKMLAVYVFEHFESFRSIQFEFGKTGRIQIGYSGCTSSQASSNTSEHYSIRGVHRSIFGPEYFDSCAVMLAGKNEHEQKLKQRY